MTAPGEYPIIFSGDSIRKITKGLKTQTRRPVLELGRKGEPVSTNYVHFWRRGVELGNELHWVGCDGVGGLGHIASPYGYAEQEKPSTLWVKETWSPDHRYVYPCPDVVYQADDYIHPRDYAEHTVGCNYDRGTFIKNFECLKCSNFKWRPAIFMPRRHCRLLLRVKDVDVVRLHSISLEDLMAELGLVGDDIVGRPLVEIRDSFSRLWDSLNADRAPWVSNPWVWAVRFEKIK